jgi:membrane associated rhomboid family serine protease
VDICPGCRGIWLDPGELASLLDAQEDLPHNPDNLAGGEHHLETTTYICPRCQGSFDTFEYAPGTGLYIDRCRDCEGIWLDAGELKKIRQLKARRRVLGLESPDESQRRLHETMTKMRARHGGRNAAGGQRDASAGVYFFQLLTGLPVEADAHRVRFPWMTLSLIVFNCFAFVFQLVAVDPGDMAFYRQYAYVPALLGQPEGWMGLVTSMFLHGGWWHLLGNMYFLWLFGDNVEDRLNRGVFLLFYLLCGVAASLVHTALTDNPYIPTLGASGAISGVMGAYLVLYPRRRMYQIFWFVQFKVSVAFYLLFWLGLQFLFSGLGASGVAWYAHIGGFAIGAAGIWLLRRMGLVQPESPQAAQPIPA